MNITKTTMTNLVISNIRDVTQKRIANAKDDIENEEGDIYYQGRLDCLCEMLTVITDEKEVEGE